MLDAIKKFRQDMPEFRKLHKVSNSDSRSVVIPKRVLNFWKEHYGSDIIEVAIWTDGLDIRISPKAPVTTTEAAS